MLRLHDVMLKSCTLRQAQETLIRLNARDPIPTRTDELLAFAVIVPPQSLFDTHVRKLPEPFQTHVVPKVLRDVPPKLRENVILLRHKHTPEQNSAPRSLRSAPLRLWASA